MCAPGPRQFPVFADRTALAHYTIGPGYVGLNEVAKAKAELRQSVELSPDLLGARTALADLR